MVKVRFKYGNESRVVHLPEDVHEISFDKFLRLNEAYSSGDVAKVLCAWYLLSPEELDAIPASEYAKLTDAIKWFGAQTVKIITNSPLPQTIESGGGKYDLPFGISFKLGKKMKAIPKFRSDITLAQTLQFDDYVGQIDDPAPHLYASLCAYIVPIISPESKTLEERMVIARSMPATVAYPLASFFLKRRKRQLAKSLRLPSLSVLTPKWLALSISLAGLALLICYILWQAGTF